ncbi:ABC transporter ATP-binding protein [Brachybacterium alimentarium]|uniref:ABC transporter ATP-binding protein n=1 Tax=Brachybacterium alimentarium TaxID=47845 RepID=UPI000DF31E03|nr:ABC transporter ATP-binding protein [Brachybacterium alimentarium]RCS71095.1 ABC transporter ATP-binding protein [Brachybacterium alimentarium]RCS90416.1 ABC transporter ATP-binding protein [Brachybacterium alimentarium]
MLGTMSRLWQTVRPIRFRLYLGLFSALTASIVALMIPQVLEFIVNRLESDAVAATIWTGGAIVLALGLVEAALIWMRRTFAVAPSTTVEKLIRVDFYRKVQNMPVSFHDAWGSGQLLSRMLTDISQIRRWIAFGMIMAVTSAVTVMVGMALLWRSSAILAIIFFLAAVPVSVIAYRFNRSFSVLSRRSQDQNGDLATTIEQSVQGIRVLKAFGRGPSALEGFTEQAEELRTTEVRKATAIARFDMFMFMLPELALGAALLVGLHLTANGSISTGQLASYFATATLVVGPVRQLGMLLGQAVNATTALDRHYDVMDAANRITSPQEPVAVDPARAVGAVRLDGLHFRYEDAPDHVNDVLDGVDLEIRPGETMALVGVTGSGKSTLLQLVPRLYDVTAGAITIDGVDVREMDLITLRTLTAVAFEDATLFSDSVRENVLLGAAASLSEEEREQLLELALRTADATFAFDLPDGVGTPIGEEGMSLSGGQRQRLALARAIAARPAVLLLDDPLSALDTKTEETVTGRLREVLAGTTTLIVAHRTSTVALADRVALLDHGRVITVGTHTELMKTSPRYRWVIANQEEEVRRDQDIETLTGELELSAIQQAASASEPSADPSSPDASGEPPGASSGREQTVTSGIPAVGGQSTEQTSGEEDR